MIAKAVSKYNRISPRKTRLLTRMVKGKTVEEAYAILAFANKRAARFILQTLKSAFDNARKKDSAFNESGLYISMISADGGPTLKRYRAASMGRAGMIRKRTSHITVHLKAKKAPKKKDEAKKAPAKKGAIFAKKKPAEKKKARPSGRRAAAAKK